MILLLSLLQENFFYCSFGAAILPSTISPIPWPPLLLDGALHKRSGFGVLTTDRVAEVTVPFLKALIVSLIVINMHWEGKDITGLTTNEKREKVGATLKNFKAQLSALVAYGEKDPEFKLSRHYRDQQEVLSDMIQVCKHVLEMIDLTPEQRKRTIAWQERQISKLKEQIERNPPHKADLVRSINQERQVLQIIRSFA
jgi:hypothetical protein